MLVDRQLNWLGYQRVLRAAHRDASSQHPRCSCLVQTGYSLAVSGKAALTRTRIPYGCHEHLATLCGCPTNRTDLCVNSFHLSLARGSLTYYMLVVGKSRMSLS